MRRSRHVVLALTLLACARVHAQQLDPLETDSFIDPRDLGAVLKTNGKTEPGSDFDLLTASAGRVWNYEDRDTFTKQSRDFATLEYFKYWRDFQADAIVIVLDRQPGATTWRARFDFDGYSLVESSASNKLDFVARSGLGLVLDNYLGNTGPSYEVDYTTTVEGAKILPDALRIVGSLVVSYRHSDGGNTFRGIYSTTTDLPRPGFLGRQWRFNVGFELGYGTEFGRSRILPLKFRALTDYYVSDRIGLEFSYGPAYQVASAGVARAVDQEFLLKVFANGYAHLGPRSAN